MAYAQWKEMGCNIFKPGEQTRMMYYSVMTQANSEKEIPIAPIRSQT